MSAGDDPTLETYFFPKVKPIIEKALKDGNKGNWPLVTLYLDIKNDPPEHLAAIAKVLDNYNDWLTTAVKTDDITKVSPLKIEADAGAARGQAERHQQEDASSTTMFRSAEEFAPSEACPSWIRIRGANCPRMWRPTINSWRVRAT